MIKSQPPVFQAFLSVTFKPAVAHAKIIFACKDKKLLHQISTHEQKIQTTLNKHQN
jgi:hypothetical protein